jgi:ABC-2 type transport system ATP-binding protein
MPSVIHLEKLSKIYGKGDRSVHALEDINLKIQPGQIYGFLGPNGAGKTTTIRLLVGLIYPTNGAVHLFGKDVNRIPEVLGRVGSLVEDAAFYSFMTGWDNLEVLARTSGSPDRNRIEQLVEQVGMGDHASRKVSTYSTGMKQRLGIAAALIGDPDLVILDEPTNGLDPKGRQEIRSFIKELAAQSGRTIFLSSHLLHEVEQICDRVAIINRGRIVREGSVSDLLSGESARLKLQVSPVEVAGRVLEPRWNAAVEGDWIEVSAKPEESHKVVKWLVEHDIQVHQVVFQRGTLEEFFMDVISKEGEGGSEEDSVEGRSNG